LDYPSPKLLLPVALANLFAVDCRSHLKGAIRPSRLPISLLPCLRHLPNLDALRQQLRFVSQLLQDKAVHFLVGRQGQAWPVPDRHGSYVLIL